MNWAPGEGTGSPPFPGGSDPEVMFGHVWTPPPPVTAARSDLPSAVDGVLGRALAKKERFGTCGEFVGQVRAAMGSRGVVERPRIPPPAEASLTVYPPWVERRSRVDAGAAVPAVQVCGTGCDRVFRHGPTVETWVSLDLNWTSGKNTGQEA